MNTQSESETAAEIKIAFVHTVFYRNGRGRLVSSMVFSTLQALAMLALFPWAAPMFMAEVQNSRF